MTITTNLEITLVEQSQAQKEVTVNAAITKLDIILNTGAIDKDLTAPPGSPTDGDLYIVGTSASGDWASQDNNLAYFEQVWKFITPNEGMTLWVNDEDTLYFWNGVSWIAELQGLTKLGVNTTADMTNKLSVASSALLFNNIGNGVQVKLNKNASSDTASFLYQTNWSGRAEFGTTGDDDFHFKVSPDGSSWHESVVIDKDNGNIALKQSVSISGDLTAKRSIVTTTTAKTFALTDANTFQKCTSATATSLTVPSNSSVAFAIGDEIDIFQEGVGVVSLVAGAGVTINSKAGNLNVAAQYSSASLKKTATDVWALIGDLA